MFPDLPDKATARRLRQFFADNAYDEPTLVRSFGHTSPIYLSPEEKRRAAAGLGGSPATRVLLELFFLEKATDRQRLASALPETVRLDLAAAGMIVDDGNTINASMLLVPLGDLLVAGDRYQKLPSEQAVEHVLSVNPPARMLVNFTVRKKVNRLLDLCTGNGVQALAIADYAHEVVATDLNERALSFARFNAALNGKGNIDLRLGASFAPVGGERFDQIVCNPPYILTPVKRHMCTDNSMELDGFCRDLVSQVPAYLEQEGLLQMICEWVETEGQDWRTRLSGWFTGNGCDAWVICSGYSGIAEYVARRSQQALSKSDSGEDELAREWLEHFRVRAVTGIRSGFIQLRRRRGNNWQSFTSLGNRAHGHIGDSIASGFRARDRYLGLDDAGILGLCPMPATTVSELPASAAAPGSARLLNTSGLPVSFLASPAVRSMLRAMDGKRTVSAISDAAAQAAGLPVDKVRSECCGVVRELLGQGLLRA